MDISSYLHTMTKIYSENKFKMQFKCTSTYNLESVLLGSVVWTYLMKIVLETQKVITQLDVHIIMYGF